MNYSVYFKLNLLNINVDKFVINGALFVQSLNEYLQ